MRRFAALAVMTISGACLANAQGRPVDWPSYAGDAQRSGWEKSDSRITKDNVKDFKLVLKRKLETQQKGLQPLTPPVVMGMLISYRGFKELAFVEGGGGNLWAIDADMDRIFWQKQMVSGAAKSRGGSASCSGGFAVTPALTPPMVFGKRPAGGRAKAAASASGARAAALGGGGFGTPRPVFALTADGKLHVMNTSNGDDYEPPVNFLPAGAKSSGLTVSEGAVYSTTSGGCGGAPNAVWAIDLASPESTVASYPVTDANVSGVALGTDGTVYAQTSAGALLSLTAKDLKLKNSFTAPENSVKNAASNVPTPVVFTYKDRDLIVSAGRDGRLYLLDSSLSAPLSQTQPLSTDHGVWGGLSSWQDADGTRWVLAPVWGQVNPDLKLPSSNGPAPNGSIVAFKVDEQSGLPVLTPAWVSRDISSPEPPVITGGLAFALAAGAYGKDERAKSSSHATLYALDAETGKELYSTGSQVTAPANLTGITLANGRVYFTTNDGTLWAFGVFLER